MSPSARLNLADKLMTDPVGIGLRHPYYDEILSSCPSVGFLEIHPENYFGGGKSIDILDKIAAHYPLSFHSVGLSLGSADPVSSQHLQQIKDLVTRYNPALISDHASWSASGNAHLNDLLPLPYTPSTLDALCRNVDRVQSALGRTILVENPSSYLTVSGSTMTEFEFMNAVAERTGCGLLLDVNNVFVQAYNHGLDAELYLASIEPSYVKEMHLAGHLIETAAEETVLVDSHSRPVRAEVWQLYRLAVARFGPVPTLIEWDQDFPPLQTLLDEASQARAVIQAESAQPNGCAPIQPEGAYVGNA